VEGLAGHGWLGGKYQHIAALRTRHCNGPKQSSSEKKKKINDSERKAKYSQTIRE
jgi:hypothetical protein